MNNNKHSATEKSRAEIDKSLKEIAENKVCRAPKPDISAVASATDCTGLIPSMPSDERERESYQELSNMEIPK